VASNFAIILTELPQECWDYRWAQPHLAYLMIHLLTVPSHPGDLCVMTKTSRKHWKRTPRTIPPDLSHEHLLCQVHTFYLHFMHRVTEAQSD
jgi:hypothetical protein